MGEAALRQRETQLGTRSRSEKRIADPTVAAVPGRSREEGTANTEVLGCIWPAHPGQEGGQGRRKEGRQYGLRAGRREAPGKKGYYRTGV